MTLGQSSPPPAERASRLRRFAPLLVIVLAMAAVFATGAHRHVSLETLVRHRMTIDAFIEAHIVLAVAIFIGVYIVAVALSMPGALLLTISGGILFGTLLGAAATVVGATTGATVIFLVAKSAAGEGLVRRAGPLAVKLAEGFRSDAFNYLLFLRLVPAFPFFLINLVSAFAGVRLPAFVAATFIGIIPATVAFAFLGAGLDSVITAQEQPYRACLAAGRADCRVALDLTTIITPQLLAALAALGVIALLPVVVKRLRARGASSRSAPLA
jgi:uncharacterized membrane protein YdjX (TVP38/TMEM64 family)